MGTTVSGGFKFNFDSTHGKWSWEVIVDQNNVDKYMVINLTSPFGSINVISTPIPSDVVSAINDSLNQVQQQLTPVMSFVGTVGTQTVTVVEGSSKLPVSVIQIMNTGAFGSLLSVNVTSDAFWLSATQSFASGVGKNQTCQFTINVSPSTLLNTGSPYSANLYFNDKFGNTLTVPFVVTVQSRPTVSFSQSNVAFDYNMQTGVFTAPQSVSISNSGQVGSILNYNLSKVHNAGWFSFTPTYGSNLSANSSVVTQFLLVQSGFPTVPGLYTETVIASTNNATNNNAVFTVSLNVT